MLIQHSLNLTPKMRLVNKALIGLIIAGSAMALPASASASIYNGANIKTSEHQVKFKISDLNTEDGLAAVYAMLEKKAAKACAIGHNVDLDGNPINKKACAVNLTEQFISSADLEPLKQYHLMKRAETKTASLPPY